MGLARTYQITHLFPNLTVLDHCALGVQVLRAEKRHLHRAFARYPRIHERAREMLAAGGLLDQAEIEARRLSYGGRASSSWASRVDISGRTTPCTRRRGAR